MKKTIALFIIIVFFTQPLYGLAPQAPDWGELADSAVLLGVAPELAKLRDEQSPETRSDIQRRVEALLAQVENTKGVVPQWNTLTFNSDNSFEIVIDYVDTQNRSNLIINRFVPAAETYYVEVIRDTPRIDNRIIRGALGLNLSRVVPAGPVLDSVKETDLPRALEYRRRLVGGVAPETGDFAYLYAVSDSEPVQQVLRTIAQVRERINAPIKTVVVIGIGRRVLGNRAVIQTLGSQEIKFIFPDNVANPSTWLSELEGVNPNEVLLYVNSKAGSTEEKLINLWFFLEWMIKQMGPSNIAGSLLEKLQGIDLAVTKLLELSLTDEERALLQNISNRIVVSTIPSRGGPVYNFAVNNSIPIIPHQESIEGKFSVLFRSGQFTTALAGYDIEAMRQAVIPLASASKEENPELNPALETAMYAYSLNMPILAAISSNNTLGPLFEWARQLINEGLGKEGKGPYFTSAVGSESSQDLMKAPKDKLFLVINVGKEKLPIPEGVRAIEINIPELNAENLARIFLFLEEFTVRYAAFLGVNPITKPWVKEISKILARHAEEFNKTPEAREQENLELINRNEADIKGGLDAQAGISSILNKLTTGDTEQIGLVPLPETESEFQNLLSVGKNRMRGRLEELARNMAGQLYIAEKLGKSVNPFFIYSASPKARLLGEFIKYLGQKRSKRLARYGGGIVWDYLIGIKDHYSTAQFLGAGNDIALTTFLHFLQEPELTPPVITANGLVHDRFAGMTPHEISTLFLQAFRQALNNEGRITNTIEIPNEGNVNLARTYALLARASELYARLVEYENQGGTTLETLVAGNESTVIGPQEGAKTGDFGKETPIDAVDSQKVVIPMQISAVATKRFIKPHGVEPVVVVGRLNRFIARINLLARTILGISARQGSALNRLTAAEELKDNARPEIYVFKLEDAIAKVEVGTEIGDLWEEITIRSANTMIAKTVQEIRRVNPLARVIIYTEDERLTERRINAALDAIDAGGTFDMIVIGNSGKVLAKVIENNWAKTQPEAVEKTVFASQVKLEALKSVIVPSGKFIPFTELATVMQAILRRTNTEGKLQDDIIDSIVSSYTVWLELAGFTRDEISPYIDEFRESLKRGVGFVVSLPIPPAPKAGSVIQLLDKEYEELASTKSYA